MKNLFIGIKTLQNQGVKNRICLPQAEVWSNELFRELQLKKIWSQD